MGVNDSDGEAIGVEDAAQLSLMFILNQNLKQFKIVKMNIF